MRADCYDEVLITEHLNGDVFHQHSQSIKICVYEILAFSNALLCSIGCYLEMAPGTLQSSLHGGLVTDSRGDTDKSILEGVGEPLAVRRARIGHLHGLVARVETAQANKKRMDHVDKAITMLYPAEVPSLQINGLAHELAAILDNRGAESASGSRTSGSRTSGSRTLSKASMQGSRPGSKEEGSWASASRAASSSQQASSRFSTKEEGSLGQLGNGSAPGSRCSSKESMLPGLRSSASVPALKALADQPAAADDDDDDDGEGLLGIMGGPPPEGQPPWQHYRKMWQQMHQKAPSSYTYPIEAM